MGSSKARLKAGPPTLVRLVGALAPLIEVGPGPAGVWVREGEELGIWMGWTAVAVAEPGHLKELVRPERESERLVWREWGDPAGWFQSMGLNLGSTGEAMEEAGEPLSVLVS